MANKQWQNAEAIFDTETDASNLGWIIKVDELDDDGDTTPMTYTPPPSHYYLDDTADESELIAATAKWEGAEIVE